MRLKIPFSAKIAISAAGLVALSLSIFAYLTYRQHSAMVLTAVDEGLMAVVRNSAPLVDAAGIGADGSEANQRLVALLDELDERNPGIKEFRVLRAEGDRVLVVAASAGRYRARPGAGETYEADLRILDTVRMCVREKRVCSTGVYEDDQGSWISAFAPVLNTEGAVAGVLAADREAAELRTLMADVSWQMVKYVAAALLAALLMGVYVSGRITRPLAKLYTAATHASAGDFTPIEVSGTDEVATLMEKFNETNAALKSKMDELELLNRELEQRVVNRTQELAKSYQDLQERQQVLQREIAVARRVQETIIPKSLHRERISIDVEYIPIMAIGGDMGLVIEGAKDRFDVVVGDVTGHGIGAALVANRAYTLLSQLYAAGAPLDSTFHRLDYFLSKEIADIGIFMTIAACRFDLSKMSMECGGGGHQPTMLYRPSDGSVTELASRCGILGTGTPFCDDPPVETVALGVGDRVIMYTDGLVEAMNDAGEEFGQARLEETVRSGAGNADGRNLAARLVEAAKNFTGGYFQDDVLVLVVEIKGT